MATQAAQFDLSTAFLDQPKTLAYGLVRGAGNKILQHELADKSRVAFFILGEGPWDSLLRLWINNKLVTLPSSSTVRFHPGLDGEIGFGMGAVSTGGDQHVDQFFTLVPGGLDPITFSRCAWLALKVAPDPAAPSADLTVLADYQAMQVRQFDASGNQTAFAWTQNWAWIICDFLIRKMILREGKVNQPLVTAELARFDWPAFSAAATYYDAVLAGGQKRFSDGGVVFLGTDTADRALEQLLLMCRSFLLEANGKFSLRVDKPRNWVFTFTSDNVLAKSVDIRKTNIQTAINQLTPAFRDLTIATGSSDDATRFAIASDPQVNHEAHQRATGTRGAGLSLMPNVRPLVLDLGNNTPERVHRILNAMVIRQLGDDVDANTAYIAPFTAEWTGYEDSLRVEPGDVVLLDRSLGEEVGTAPKRSNATRIQTSGGTATQKFVGTAVPVSAAGQVYEVQVTITNNGTAAFVVANNLPTPPAQIVYPGETRNVLLVGTGDGSAPVNIDIVAGSIGDAIDCVARDPLARRAGVDENLFLTNGLALDFTTGWAGYNGAVVTLTQGAQLGVEPFLCEAMEIEENPDGTRRFVALEYMPNAFPDGAPAQQALQAPIPGSGLGTASSSVDGSGNLLVPLSNTLDSTARRARSSGHSIYRII
jgi:hypothetical protein